MNRPSAIPIEFLVPAFIASVETYTTADARAALRCGLADAAAVCDMIARQIETSNRTRGSVTKRGQELADQVRLCGDTIWALRDTVSVPKEVAA